MLGFIVNGIAIGSVYAMIAVGYALIYNVMKFSNFAHGGLISVTAYIGFFAAKLLKANFIVALLIAMIGGGLCGILVEFIGFRRLRKSKSPTIYYFISSITVGMLFQNILTIINGQNFYMYPKILPMHSFRVFGFALSVLDIIMFSVSVVALLALLFVIKRTQAGLAIRAVALDHGTATLMGINNTRIFMTVFFLAGAMAAVSGVLLGISYTVYPTLGNLVIKGFISSVIGGLGSLGGAVAGAFLLGIVEVMLTMIFGASLAPALVFGLLLVFLILRPSGIAGVFVSEKA